LSDLKLSLIRAISQSVLSLALHLTNIDVILTVEPLFEKLILYEDSKVIANVLTALAIIAQKNLLYIPNIKNQFIQFITDLLGRAEENIILSAIGIWTIIIANESQSSNLVKETRLMIRFGDVVKRDSRHHIIKEIGNFVDLLLQKISTALNLLIDSEIIPVLINALLTADYFSKLQVLSTLFKIIIASNQSHLTYLLHNRIIEAFAALLTEEDTNLTIATLEAYHYILIMAQKFALIDLVVSKGRECYLNAIISSLDKHQNPYISNEALSIKTLFSSPQTISAHICGQFVTNNKVHIVSI